MIKPEFKPFVCLEKSKVLFHYDIPKIVFSSISLTIILAVTSYFRANIWFQNKILTTASFYYKFAFLSLPLKLTVILTENSGLSKSACSTMADPPSWTPWPTEDSASFLRLFFLWKSRLELSLPLVPQHRGHF